MEVYNKLVRDDIDTLINSNGKNEVAVIRILSDGEYKFELLRKLDEELKELKEALLLGNKEDIIEESADLIEVIRALNDDNLELVMEKLEDKRKKKGGFTKKKYLEVVKKTTEQIIKKSLGSFNYAL